jgi:hypothetical protein
MPLIVASLPHIAHPGYIVFIGVALFCAIRACFVDVFIDESESSPSEFAREKRGWRATRVTRPIMVLVFALMAAVGVWKMLKP